MTSPVEPTSPVRDSEHPVKRTWADDSADGLPYLSIAHAAYRLAGYGYDPIESARLLREGATLRTRFASYRIEPTDD